MQKASPYKHIYNSKAWKNLRLLRLADEPLCRLCKAIGIIKPGHHVDHIIPLTKGGEPYEWDNTQSLCQSHHTLKTLEDEGKHPNWGCDRHGNPLAPKHHWNQ
jgi:5-methylcytosine-specific restriction endonuclease McrA